MHVTQKAACKQTIIIDVNNFIIEQHMKISNVLAELVNGLYFGFKSPCTLVVCLLPLCTESVEHLHF